MTTFADRMQFSSQLMVCVRDLLRVEGDGPRLLVISAHGIPLTGTDLQASEGESIDLWVHADLFAGLPSSVLIYLSACFGAYPSACAIQDRSTDPPCVVGPLVDIQFEHANAMQNKLLDLLDAGSSLRSLIRLIATQNNKLRLSYDGRETFGMYDRKKRFYPGRTAGAQLAAPVSQRSTYTVLELISRGSSGTPTHCRVEDEHSNVFEVGLAPLLVLATEVEDLIGRRFIGRHQLLEAGDAGRQRASIVQVRRR